MKPIKVTSDDGFATQTCLITGKPLDDGYVRLSAGIYCLGSPFTTENVEAYLSFIYRRDVMDENKVVSVTKAVDYDLISAPQHSQFVLLFAGVAELRTFFDSICNHLEEEIQKEEGELI